MSQSVSQSVSEIIEYRAAASQLKILHKILTELEQIEDKRNLLKVTNSNFSSAVGSISRPFLFDKGAIG